MSGDCGEVKGEKLENGSTHLILHAREAEQATNRVCRDHTAHSTGCQGTSNEAIRSVH